MKEWNISEQTNMGKSQKPYATWMKVNTKDCVWINLYEILEDTKLQWQKVDHHFEMQ